MSVPLPNINSPLFCKIKTHRIMKEANVFIRALFAERQVHANWFVFTIDFTQDLRWLPEYSRMQAEGVTMIIWWMSFLAPANLWPTLILDYVKSPLLISLRGHAGRQEGKAVSNTHAHECIRNFPIWAKTKIDVMIQDLHFYKTFFEFPACQKFYRQHIWNANGREYRVFKMCKFLILPVVKSASNKFIIKWYF